MQEGADARNEENGADKVALGQGVMLQAQVLGQNERHSYKAPQGCEEVLWTEQKEVGMGTLPSASSSSKAEAHPPRGCSPKARSENSATGPRETDGEQCVLGSSILRS